MDSHDAASFAPIAQLTVGEFRNWLLEYETDARALSAVAPGLTPEMVAAVTKLMGNQDLILVAQKCRVTVRGAEIITHEINNRQRVSEIGSLKLVNF